MELPSSMSKTNPSLRDSFIVLFVIYFTVFKSLLYFPYYILNPLVKPLIHFPMPFFDPLYELYLVVAILCFISAWGLRKEQRWAYTAMIVMTFITTCIHVFSIIVSFHSYPEEVGHFSPLVYYFIFLALDLITLFLLSRKSGLFLTKNE